MKMNQLIKSFVELSDESKANVIRNLMVEGYSEEDLRGLTWLSILSNNEVSEKMFRSILNPIHYESAEESVNKFFNTELEATIEKPQV